MKQTTLIAEESTFVGVENVMPTADQLPAVVVNPEHVPSESIRDLRSGFMMMPAAQMQSAMAEARERRDTFRKWLLSQLVEGVHFGFSPGTIPKWGRDGKPCDEKDANGTIGKIFVPFTSWRPKKSLYAAGADFVCDLLGVRDELATDHNGWVQAGSAAGTFVVNCNLISRSTGEVLANGLGLALAGGEQLGANAALKKAGKRAKVAAVLDYVGLRDLFTQDTEDGADRNKVPNPEQVPDAPIVPPRSKRVDKSDVANLVRDWKAEMQRQGKHPDDINPEAWSRYAQLHSKRRFDVKDANQWTEQDFILTKKALEAAL